MNYKAPDNSLHFLDDGSFVYLLPAGSVQITESEANAIREANVPPPPTPQVPQSVTMRQARLALLQAGLLSQVNNAVANAPGAQGESMRIEWEFSSTVERNRPLVQALAASLGITSAQMDNLFTLAATL